METQLRKYRILKLSDTRYKVQGRRWFVWQTHRRLYKSFDAALEAVARFEEYHYQALTPKVIWTNY